LGVAITLGLLSCLLVLILYIKQPHALSVKQMLDPQEAAKIGCQIGADIVIVGRMIEPDLGNDHDELNQPCSVRIAASGRTKLTY
jgi:hypothetical protein